MRRVSLIFAFTAAASLVGCDRNGDLAAEGPTIRQLEQKWVQAVAARDTAAIVDLYAEDGALLPPGAPRARGPAALRAAWGAILKTPNLSLTFESSEVIGSSAGDLVAATGPYELGLDGPGGRHVEDTGKFVEVWKRVNGQWKVLYNIFNSDKST